MCLAINKFIVIAYMCWDGTVIGSPMRRKSSDAGFHSSESYFILVQKTADIK